MGGQCNYVTRNAFLKTSISRRPKRLLASFFFPWSKGRPNQGVLVASAIIWASNEIHDLRTATRLTSVVVNLWTTYTVHNGNSNGLVISEHLFRFVIWYLNVMYLTGQFIDFHFHRVGVAYLASRRTLSRSDQPMPYLKFTSGAAESLLASQFLFQNSICDKFDKRKKSK